MVDDSLHSHESNAMNNFFTNMTPRSKFTSDYLILLRVNFGLRFIPLLILLKFLYLSTAQHEKVVIIWKDEKKRFVVVLFRRYEKF